MRLKNCYVILSSVICFILILSSCSNNEVLDQKECVFVNQDSIVQTWFPKGDVVQNYYNSKGDLIESITMNDTFFVSIHHTKDDNVLFEIESCSDNATILEKFGDSVQFVLNTDKDTLVFFDLSAHSHKYSFVTEDDTIKCPKKIYFGSIVKLLSKYTR